MAALLIPAPLHSHPHRPAPRRPQLSVVPVPAYSPAGARQRAMAPVYRRRRIGVVLMLATFIILGDHAASAVARAVSTPAVAPATSEPSAAAVTPAVVPVASQTVVVQSGDTLWSIARVLQPDGDVRSLVDELARRAGGSGVQAGQRIDVAGLGAFDPAGRS